MSRKAGLISIEELYKKTRVVGIYDKLMSLQENQSLEELDNYPKNEIPSINELIRNCPKLKKDLSKIFFETENYMYDYGGLSGFHTLDNGLAFLGVVAGGDWELPVFSIIYWDGKDLRGYTPSSGNIFNPVSKTAFGSEEEREYLTNQHKLPISKKELSKIEKTLKDLNGVHSLGHMENKDRYQAYASIRLLFENLDFNWNRIEEDIKNRIEVLFEKGSLQKDLR